MHQETQPSRSARAAQVSGRVAHSDVIYCLVRQHGRRSDSRMYLTDEQLILSPSDLNGFVECRHLTALDRRALARRDREARPARPRRRPPLAQGRRARARYLEQLKAEGKTVIEIGRRRPLRRRARSRGRRPRWTRSAKAPTSSTRRPSSAPARTARRQAHPLPRPRRLPLPRRPALRARRLLLRGRRHEARHDAPSPTSSSSSASTRRCSTPPRAASGPSGST